jgi:hypothetical protein
MLWGSFVDTFNELSGTFEFFDLNWLAVEKIINGSQCGAHKNALSEARTQTILVKFSL